MLIVIRRLNTNELELVKRESSDSLVKYAAEVKKDQEDKDSHYDRLLKAREEEQHAQALIPFAGTRPKALKPIEKPLDMNKVEIYDPDVFGLEVAARHCRFEMIKIVREVY